jgi:uracil phosphoribosyltransferase
MTAMDRPTPMRGREQPTREAVLHLPQLHLLNHPVAASLVTSLRDVRTPSREFARAIDALTRFLLWRALEEIETVMVEVPGHAGPVTGPQLAGGIAGVAVLRAGLSMTEPLRQMIPGAPGYLVGVRRDEATLEPSVYYTNLPLSFDGVEHVLLLDPMLATGGSTIAALRIIRSAYAGPLSCLAMLGAPVGIQRLIDTDPSVRVYLAALDERLDDHGYILPGLGDAGDRLFDTS